MNCCSTHILAPVQSLPWTIYACPNQFSPDFWTDGWLTTCLWAEILIFKCFGGHIDRHLGLQDSYTIFTTGDQIPGIEYIKIDSSFVFLADLWAEILIFSVFWWPYWPPSWISPFLRYIHYWELNPWLWIYKNLLFICLWLTYELRHRYFRILTVILAAILAAMLAAVLNFKCITYFI